MEQHVPKFSIKRTNFGRYTQIFEIFFLEVFFPFIFAAGIIGWMVSILEIQQFPEFLETFPGNFCTICRSFQIFESLGWVESALGLGTLVSNSCSILSSAPPPPPAAAVDWDGANSPQVHRSAKPQANSPISYAFRLIWLCVWVFQVRIYYDFISYPWIKFCFTLFQTHYHALPLLVC